MQFLGGRRTAYIFIATDSLVVRDVGIASNRRIVQICVTGYVEVRRIRRAADGLVAFDRRGTVRRRISLGFRIASRRLVSFDCLVAVNILNQIFDNLLLFIAERAAVSERRCT